ncbi:pectinesterase family protein [Cellulomonas biazotea]|uniref:Pectinesterase n=1 Tax=Cellulomonas biazotea TaxID=1709 RepID=A0A402DSL0_9CELL|nr:pectinesterase family protein [Cellulomonas biazotea]GCE77056.1 pectinesterase [Cellulomonas biazotea]
MRGARPTGTLTAALALATVLAAALPTAASAVGPDDRLDRGHAAVRADATVGPDRRADFTTVQAAIDAAPEGRTSPWVIALRPGTYHEVVKVPATKPFLTLVGTGRRAQDVVVSYDNANGTPKPDGSGTHGTSGSASVTIDGADFTARNLTFANTFDEAAHPEITNRQAVAVLTRADRLVFDGVRFLGNQDTLYVNSTAADVVARASFRDCYVEGDVDFVFGRATAVFEGCEIRSLTRGSTTNNGYVTAPSTSVANPYGFLFTRCRFTSDAPDGTVFLGRPWHPSNDPNAIGQVLVRDSWIGAHVGGTAWSDFSGGWSWRDARFAEHANRGPGALVTDDRPQLTPAEAKDRTPRAYLAGADGWSPRR